MMSEGKRHTGRAIRGTALLIPLVLAGYWLWTRGERTPSRFDDALDRALSPVVQASGLGRELGSMTSSQARILSRDLARRSVVYLGARDLEEWGATRARVARASKAACARLWKGGDDSFFGPAVAQLGPESLEQYTRLLGRALALRLEQKAPPPTVTGVLARGLTAIAEQLPDDARAKFEADAKRSDVSDERACELFLTLSSGAEKLEPGLRVEFYRALAAELQVPLAP
ncbi:MAG TPA: hypothetical protein VHP33_08215 [Polyangiaceae bacterium]|nr:hypothetical protein [Polyangiaceae bacterium]